MDNPKYEHDDDEQHNSTVNSGNLQLNNYDTETHDVTCKYHIISFYTSLLKIDFN